MAQEGDHQKLEHRVYGEEWVKKGSKGLQKEVSEG